ncbi:MAG: THC0290_0291 family protein [Bacteroidota bacterium]
MKTKLFSLLILGGLTLFPLSNYAQTSFHELSFGAGPVSFRGDWGERGDNKTNLGNTGYGASLIHHVNFAYGNTSAYFNQHFKMRNQLMFHYTELSHYGRWSEGNSTGAIMLQEMYGETRVLEIGTGLEWNWFDIRSYERQTNTFQPYAGAGISLVYFNPESGTNLNGRLGSVENTFPTFLPANSGDRERINDSSEITLSVNFQLGTRYRLSQNFDLFAEAKWHFYGSDFVDGLDPRGSQNKSNDWMFMFQIGGTYYLD